MHLRSIQLINWRSYSNARFEFPRPHGERNVTLVMAPNEYGKTSLFEALTLGLFGKDGLILVPRARLPVGNDTEDRLEKSYSEFLQLALHHRAAETGHQVCTVTLEWEDENRDRIEIKRTWYFRADGAHRITDDQLQIYAGEHREPIAPPSGNVDRDRWYREWIAQHFLQPHLAEFFLFDGEQVQRYASRDMGDQVRRGIEGLLGLPVLRGLKDSLERYARNRRTRSAKLSDERVNAVKSAIEELENRIEKKKTECDEADAHLSRLQPEIDDLTQRLGGQGGGTVALIASLVQDEERYREEARRAIQDLTTLIAGDMALAIAGAPLRHETIGRLKSEAKRETWENGRNEGSRNLDRFIADLSGRIEALEPPLGGDSSDAVLGAARAAWDALWHPPPAGCADDYFHVALTGTTRARTIERLSDVERHTAGGSRESHRTLQGFSRKRGDNETRTCKA